MVSRILNFMKKTAVNSLRNNMVIYMVLFPVVLALGLNIFMPSVTEMETAIAVDDRVDEKVIQEFEKYGKVELYPGPEEVKERVEKLDDISGIIKDGDEYVVVLEGNEPEETADMARAVMNMVLGGSGNITLEHKSLNKDNTLMQELSGGLLILTAILIAGLVIGMSLIEEKESSSIRALAVSPLRLGEFIISHSLTSLIVGLLLTLLSIFILFGTDVNYISVIIATIVSAGIGIFWGFLIGGLADNLISAIAVIKSTAFFLVSIPVASVYVPENFRWVFFPFPNYWAFEAYRNIFNGGKEWVSFHTACLVTFVYSIILVLAIVPTLRKRLNLS